MAKKVKDETVTTPCGWWNSAFFTTLLNCTCASPDECKIQPVCAAMQKLVNPPKAKAKKEK